MYLLRHTVTLFVIVHSVYSAKILGVFDIASVSHQVVFQPIWRELSLRGHQVTVLTPNPLKDPTLTNLTEIDLGSIYKIFNNLAKDFSLVFDHWQLARTWPETVYLVLEEMLANPEVSALINDTSKEFDVVLVENLTPGVSAFAARFKCPLIVVASLGVLSPIHSAMGNPVHPLLHPEMFTTYGVELSFLERIDAVLHHVYYRYKHNYEMIPKSDQIIRKYFGNELPYLGELERNFSMLFLNTNPVIHRARPYVPGVIEMGRMHIKPKKPLPKDLQDFLDEAKEGVIYFSLGTNIRSIYIDQEKRKMIMDVFSQLPYKVLWKFEDDHMNGKPSNVKISKWLPQQDVLGHPNIRLFITQAGLQSIEESIVNKVPILAMPFLADQFYNAKRCAYLGNGLHLDFATLTKENFKNAILEITGSSRYKNKVVEIADILTDEPESGLDRAVWWTEYVIRHRGAPYFRSPALDMPWYQYYLLDVICFFVAMIALTLYSVYRLLDYVIVRSKLFTVKKKNKVL